MRSWRALFVATIALVVTAAAACSQPTAPPAPTAAPAAPPKAAEPTKAAAPAPTKPAEPTKAPAAKPTEVPAKKVDYPTKGKTISMVLGFPAGGGVDIPARAIVPGLEKELGVPFEVLNKVGAGGQIGLTEVARARPDGYTIGGASNPPAIVSYLDPSRQAVYDRKTFQPLAQHLIDPCMLAVRGDSPYKTMKDVIDAAKANPEKIKAADSGMGLAGHLMRLATEKQTGARFAGVHFEGGPQSITALLGGHVDVYFDTIFLQLPHFKSGDMRILGIADKQESRFFPGVKTMESQGYPLEFATVRGYWVHSGTPREIVSVLDGAFKKAIDNPEHKKKMEDTGFEVDYLDSARFSAYWDEMEASLKPLMEIILKERDKP